MFKVNEIKTALSLIIQGAAAERPLDEILEALKEEIQTWERGADAFDDLTRNDEDYRRNYEGK